MSAAAVRQKLFITMPQILLMNLGLFGVQYSFGTQQAAISPIYQFLGADPEEMPLPNLAGPITGLLTQPVIGVISGKTRVSRWDRGRPLLLTDTVSCSVCLFLFPFASAVWMAVLLLWLLDVPNNTTTKPHRAFISNRLSSSRLTKDFPAQPFLVDLGVILANVSLFASQQVVPGIFSSLPSWVMTSLMLGTAASIATVLASILSTKELEPTLEELAELRAHKIGFVGILKEIWGAVVEMPVQLYELALVYLFQWYAMSCCWQYVSLSVGESIFGATNALKEAGPDRYKTLFKQTTAWAGLISGIYNIATFCVAFALVVLTKRRGAKFVHTTCLLLTTIGLAFFPHIIDKYLLFMPIIGLGIAWVPILGVPYIMAVRVILSTRYGVCTGIINMMIVVPMLIQTVTFGAVYKLIDDHPGNAITFATVLLALAAITMLWIKEPSIVGDVNDLSEPMPAKNWSPTTGGEMPRDYTTVVVGTDGPELAVPTVTRAAWITTKEDADLIIVRVCGGGSRRADTKVPLTETAPSRIGQVPGKEAATLAVTQAKDIAIAVRARVKATLLVEADPAEALLSSSKQHLGDLIMIDAVRGRSIADRLLGGVANVVVRRAHCDVLVIRPVNPGEDEQIHPESDA